LNAGSHTAYLLLGGNLGDRIANLAEARRLLSRHAGKLLCCSSIYETEAWGLREQPAFLNQALALQTALSPQGLLAELLRLEALLGRERKERYGPRLIDMDILLYDDAVIAEPRLSVPHPQLHLRRFALIPLGEIAPDLLHPASGRTISQLLEACPDSSEVHNFRVS